MIKEAKIYDKLNDKKVQCKVCAHKCMINNGERGFCKVRDNQNGTLFTLNYSTISSEASDPIEKKPLYHFYPGTIAYSIGTIGCNFKCKHCQNWSISQTEIKDANTIELNPQSVVQRALSVNAKTIAWTYNEPTIWYEYTLDCAILAKQMGLATAYITNGYITPEALQNIAPYLDAFRVDIKAFSDDFYRNIAGARLQPVLDATKMAHELGIHVEIINLIIPGQNDSIEEINLMTKWIAENLGVNVPVHFTRFYPQYKLTHINATSVQKLEEAWTIGRQNGLNYVYIGNVHGHKYENTYCPQCDYLLIERTRFTKIKYDIKNDKKCPNCGYKICIID